MVGLSEVSGGPARHVMHQYLLLVALVRLVTGRDEMNQASVPEIPKMTTRAEFPYNFWEDEEERPVRPRRPTQPARLISTTTTTQVPTTIPDSSYDYYFERHDGFGSDPSTWKLLPIQIPDDLVSNAILHRVKTSVAPTYATPSTTQHRYTSATQHPRTMRPEKLHSTSTDQEQNWDHHSSDTSGRTPKPQNWDRYDVGNSHSDHKLHQDWDRLDSDATHSNLRPHHKWERHDTRNSHSNPAPQQNWDRHDTESSHSMPKPHLWERHNSKSDQSNTKPQQQIWNHHSSKSSHRNPNPNNPQQNWQKHSYDTAHGTPAPQHQTWDRHNSPHHPQHSPQPSQHLHYNWSHTTDGYDIRNYHANNHESAPNHHTDDPQNSDNYRNDLTQYSMPPEPSAWNMKPPDASSWQQNIVERLSQHLPKLPSLSSLRIPGLSSLTSFSLPKWSVGESGHQPQDPGYSMATRGNYVHKFYHLIPESDPLDHLNSNRDRNSRPLYTYPPNQRHEQHDSTLEHTQNNNNKHQTHHHSDTDHMTTQELTDTTQHHTNDPQANQHESYNSYTHHTSLFPQRARPDPRRPFQRPQRILKLPQHQKHEATEHQHWPNRHSWTWEVHDTPTPSHPYKDSYNRRPSTHNWIDTGFSGSYDHSSTTHKDFYAPNTYSSHPQEVYDYTPSYGQPQYPPQHHHQHLQHPQQALSNPWYPENQLQHDYNAGFNSDLYDNILEPLSSLLSRPSALSIIDSSPYQQSIIERLTGVDTSSTSSFVFPGGVLVLGLALALFYFNFVWYPTPVVTAKIYKMLSQSVPDGELSEGQERAVGEVRLRMLIFASIVAFSQVY
ncbi:hypothetical protein E2C01_020868 [Portunus trituberculatus]|uniref:Uncharacterized protein n=1 Tax=Portunus trituberculatus TaxID=210409 RepID=A0A5B7E2R7_PORTR|nr:hypothetical protein [Portunus trituberculatus]